MGLFSYIGSCISSIGGTSHSTNAEKDVAETDMDAFAAELDRKYPMSSKARRSDLSWASVRDDSKNNK